MSREMFFCEFHNGHCVGRRTAMTCMVRNIYMYINICIERCSSASFTMGTAWGRLGTAMTFTVRNIYI